VVGAIVDEIEHRDQLTGERTLGRLRTTGEIADELGVSLPDYPDANV
jgi:hypothetical protein